VKLLRPTRHFGMKAHIGVDSKEGIVHSVCSTAASVSDIHMLPELLHGDEKKVWGDTGYQGQTEAIHQAAHAAQDMTSQDQALQDAQFQIRKDHSRIGIGRNAVGHGEPENAPVQNTEDSEQIRQSRGGSQPRLFGSAA
jgi:hypothetical protein